MTVVYISLGSNLGDKISYIQQAVKLLNDNENFKLNVNEKFLNESNTNLASDLQKSQAKLEELQKMINLCNKNKTCKALLNDLLKNGK